MPPLEFPSSPANGATNAQFQYDASITAWRNQGSTQNVGTAIAKLQTASPITVANQAERDALYPTPVQGNSVFRNDTARFETYYNAVGNTPAGWTTAPDGGMVAIKPSSVGLNGGTATITSIGKVNFQGTSGVYLYNVFNTSYRNYLIVISSLNAAAGTPNINARMVNAAGTQESGAFYYEGGLYTYGGSSVIFNGVGNTAFEVHNAIDGVSRNAINMRLNSPYASWYTELQSQYSGWAGSVTRNGFVGGFVDTTTSYPSLYIYAANSTQITGEISVYGIAS